MTTREFFNVPIELSPVQFANATKACYPTIEDSDASSWIGEYILIHTQGSNPRVATAKALRIGRSMAKSDLPLTVIAEGLFKARYGLDKSSSANRQHEIEVAAIVCQLQGLNVFGAVQEVVFNIGTRSHWKGSSND